MKRERQRQRETERENLKFPKGQHNTVSKNRDHDVADIQTEVGSWWNDMFNTEKSNLTQKVSPNDESNRYN